MARKGGAFNFAKRAKELKKQKKRQEKLERKRKAAESGAPSPSDEIVDADDFLSMNTAEHRRPTADAEAAPDPKPDGGETPA